MDGGSTLDLAVVVVSWNNADCIAAALGSVLDDLRASGLSHEVWLVDSASTDATVSLVRDRFPQVKLIAHGENIGFGAGNNLALRRMGFVDGARMEGLPRTVFLLNPDTITQQGACRSLYDALMAGDDIGLVGARLSYGDGAFQHSAFRFPDLRQIWSEFFPTPGRLLEGRFNGRYPRAWYASRAAFEVDFTLGATMMLRRDAILQTGGFDEDFFLYCEEVDWAWRLKRGGWRVLCAPSAHVTHLGGGSTSKARPRSLIHLWKSRLLLYDKHYPRWKSRAARRLLRAGMQRQLRALGGAEPELGAACQRIIEMAKS